MKLDETISRITDRIIARSAETRRVYLARMAAAQEKGPARSHLSCSGQAHAFAGAGVDQAALAAGKLPNLGDGFGL